MKELAIAILIAITFTGWVVWASPYGSQHEPLESLLWIYQNINWDL
tara:strand:+ start:85 stop:222 length:138 start_codon:yes stop_codon:yes gene_type:complete